MSNRSITIEHNGTTYAGQIGIAHPPDDSKVFVPKEHADAWRAAEGGA